MNKIKLKKNVVIGVGVGVVTLITSLICLSSGCDKKVEKNSNYAQVATTTTSTTGTTSTCTSTSTTESEITTTTNSTTLATTTAVTDVVTTSNRTTTVSETSTTTPVLSTNTTTHTVPSTTQQIVEYVVFKPSTHYIHRNTCRWNDNTTYKIDSTSGIESRKCTECNPNMDIVNEYVPPVISVEMANVTDRQYLAEIVWHEAGSDWIGIYDKAMIAAGVMNRVNDPRFPNTVYGVLTQRGQFSGFCPGTCIPTQSCYDAVDYYFNHVNEFGNHNSWVGDGYANHFYYQ